MAPRLSDPEARNVGLIASLMVLVFLVMLAVFLYISRLTRAGDADRVDRAATGSPASAIVSPTLVATATDVAPLGDFLLPTPPEQQEWVRFADPRFDFRIDLPATWRAAVTSLEMPSFPRADRDVVFEAPDAGARMAVSVWDGAPPDDSLAWVASVAPGLKPVDGQWPGAGQVAGVAAAVLWDEETPTTPARYAVCLAHGLRRYRIAYAAADGGARIGVYARTIASLEFGADDTADTVPRLPLPAGRYFPRQALYGSP